MSSLIRERLWTCAAARKLRWAPTNISSICSQMRRRKPLRLWIQVSENDNGAKTASENRRNWVIANSRLAKILKDKGYPYQFVYSKGAGHTQRKVINNSLPQALEYVWQGYSGQN